MITTFLDLLGALLIIAGLCWLAVWVGWLAPPGALITAGALVTLFSLFVSARKGGAK
jgi:hypothetical protein